MNRYARTIVMEFSSRENRRSLHKELSNFFNNPKVFRFLDDHLDDNIDHFIETIEQEMSVSDPMPGITISEQIRCYNNQFLKDRVAYIKTHVLGADERAPMYMIKDNLPTSRHGIKHYQKNPNDILKTWLANSGRPVQAREDTPGDIYSVNPYYGQGDSRMATGIVVCDQSNIGTSNHVDQYENTSYKLALNRGHLPHEETAFGVSNPAADARLLSRRIFRSNEAGIENGIPSYEARLYRRNLERNISEGLHNAEKDCMVHGYDMSSLKKRLEHKRQVRDKYSPACDQKTQLRLHHNDARVPDDMRYC